MLPSLEDALGMGEGSEAILSCEGWLLVLDNSLVCNGIKPRNVEKF